MEICKVPTLRLKAVNKHTHIMYIEMEKKKTYFFHFLFHSLCADWLSLYVKLGNCNPPAAFYLIVVPILHAFTYKIVFTTDDFNAPCNNNNILYSSQRKIKDVVRSHNEEHISIILNH